MCLVPEDSRSLGSLHPPRSMSLWILEGESEGLFGMARKARLPEKPHGPGSEVEDLFSPPQDVWASHGLQQTMRSQLSIGKCFKTT